MSRVFALLLMIVPVLLTVFALFGAVATALRWTVRVAVALGGALVVSLLAPAGAGGWLPLLVFVSVLALLSVRGRVRRRPPTRMRVIERTIDSAPAGPGPAWRELRTLADWRTRRRLDAAIDACARYLDVAESQEDPSAQLPIKIRKHLPAIIDDCVRHSRTAAPDERRALLAETLGTLESLATRAEARRRELAHLAQAEFRARQAHLNRTDD